MIPKTSDLPADGEVPESHKQPYATIADVIITQYMNKKVGGSTIVAKEYFLERIYFSSNLIGNPL